MRRNRGQSRDLAIRQSVIAQLERGDQRAVDDEVGVATDRRGEVRIAIEVEAEMAVVLVRIFGLGLGSPNLASRCSSASRRMEPRSNGKSGRKWSPRNMLRNQA